MSQLLFILILLPVIAALVCYFVRASAVRNLVVIGTGGILAAASVLLLAQGPFAWQGGSLLGVSWGFLVTILDFLLLAVILFYGFKLKNLLIQIFTLAQLALLAYFELFMLGEAEAPVAALQADTLSLVMVLIISIVGSVICIYGIPYMKHHEDHLHLETSKQPRFFFFMLLFLGAMNALVLANNLLWLYFFFEVTTFCSFALIGHDGTEIATKNATRALWMNSLGGLAFLAGMILSYSKTGTLSVDAMISGGSLSGVALVGVAFLCLAGFAKAAQLPFQSWLLGAMVAPTPVSALLHSSTMVKAGVYIVLRFAPAYAGTLVSDSVAYCGAFTFLVCAALAISQSNGKKILAYSTVSNLGLIIACAGLNTPLAIAAAIMLILFHAVSKGLLFLCVGTIEQEIGSRDIEDMQDLYGRLPRTALIATIGILTMLLPPFGVLLCKWMAIEASASNPIVVVMLALGSALTVVYWARWAGRMMGNKPEGLASEQQSVLTKLPLIGLCLGAVVLSLASPAIYTSWVMPMLGSGQAFAQASGWALGAFWVVPLFVVIGLGALYAWWKSGGSANVRVTAPYLGGAQTGPAADGAFNGPMNAPVAYESGNYYLADMFGEQKLTFWVNVGAIVLIVLMIGGGL